MTQLTDLLALGARDGGETAGLVDVATADVLASRQSNPVFERTLARAVERGFIPAADQDAVRERVGRLASDYGFEPDDFDLPGGTARIRLEVVDGGDQGHHVAGLGLRDGSFGLLPGPAGGHEHDLVERSGPGPRSRRRGGRGGSGRTCRP